MIRSILLYFVIIGECWLHASSDGQASYAMKYITKAYFEKYETFEDSGFSNFLSNEIPPGLNKVLQDKNYTFPTLSVLHRNILGEGSHRHLSSSIGLKVHNDSTSELAANSCLVIIIERLPSGVFADPFELQHLVQRNVFTDAAVFGDTNLELPSFRSNQSVLEIHTSIASSAISRYKEDLEINLEVPLHARYQPLGLGFSKVGFREPYIFMCYGLEDKELGKNCLFMPTNNDKADNTIIWEVPCGKKEHAEVVSAVTFGSAIVAAFVVVVASICYSDSTISNKLKNS